MNDTQLTIRRQLRFGVQGPTGLTSPYWTMRAGPNDPDLYISCSEVGAFFHVSFHRGQSHVKVLWQQRDHTQIFEGPAEFVPGFRRAIQIRVPPAAANQATERLSRVVWVAPPAAADQWTVFDVILEPVEAPVTTWPGQRGMGTHLVGRVTRADQSRAVVVASTIIGTSGTAGTLPPEQAAVLLEAATSGPIRDLVGGLLNDGTPWFMESIFQLPTTAT